MNKILQISLGIITVLGLVAMPFYSASAGSAVRTSVTVLKPRPALSPQTIVCLGLEKVGIACSTSGVSVGNYQPKPVKINFNPFTAANANTSSGQAVATTSVIPSAKDLNGQKINIVAVPNSQEIYELINGQKHPFPSLAIYNDYGYTLDMIQPVTQNQLDKYPRAKLIKVKGDSKVYYLTEGGMVRQVVDPKKISTLYGDRTEDIITISRKEFNFYPTNNYVYQISPLNRDVFQVSAAGKHYLTPMAVNRLGITSNQIAPISQAELNSYKTLAPVIN